jgi:hypothetical protein
MSAAKSKPMSAAKSKLMSAAKSKPIRAAKSKPAPIQAVLCCVDRLMGGGYRPLLGPARVNQHG